MDRISYFYLHSILLALFLSNFSVKAVWDLQYRFCEELDIIYLTAKENESETEPDVYLPLPSSHNVSPSWLLKVQNSLPNKRKG